MPAPIVVSIIHRTVASAQHRPEPRYLLIRRLGEPYRGRWALVGGKWDFGEALGAAVVPEVLEETGLVAEFVALRGIVSERLVPAQASGMDAAHFLLLVCQVDARDGEASEQNEGAVAWFSPEQIETLHRDQTIIPSDYVMLQRFANAPEIPHFEADMVSEPAASASESGAARLLRFEEAA
jgi:ADP-ribose pyrophosphatase YjhB (NUDIX family)